MSSKARSNGVSFSADTGEVEALYLELLQAYYEEDNRAKAGDVAVQLDAALASSPDYAYSIRGEEVRSILAELRDDLPEAIHSREAEIRKILELHARASNTPSWPYVARQYDYSDVSDRLDLLASLYDKQGESQRALATLLESKEYCLSHHVPFDAQDLLDELKQEREADVERPSVQPEIRDTLDQAIRQVYEEFGKSADEIVVAEQQARRFAAAVNQRLAESGNVPIEEIKRRLLTLRRRGKARGGLPRLRN